MKVSAFLSASVAFATASKNRTLMDVYGELEPVASMIPFYKRHAPRAAYATDEFVQMRQFESCDFPIELLLIQDTTWSFYDDMPNMVNTQLELAWNMLQSRHPGSAVGVVSFKDRPMWFYGEENDYCQRFDLKFTPSKPALIDAYKKLEVFGGADRPESQYNAICAAADAKDFPGWGSVPNAAKLMVIVTDANPHFDADGMNNFNLPAYSGQYDENDPEGQCLNTYYPSPATVAEKVGKLESYVGTLIYDADYNNGLPWRSWEWMNRFLGQPDGFLHDLKQDSSDFWMRLSEIVSALEGVECGTPSTEQPTIPETVLPQPTGGFSTVTTGFSASTDSASAGDSTECITGPCPNCPEGGNCYCYCQDGVCIGLNYKPKTLYLRVEDE